MALTASNVRVAVTGGAYFAIAGSTLPTDATTALASPLSTGELGYVTDDGITQTIDADTEQIMAWQNGDMVREVQTSHALTYELALLETNATSLDVYYGDYTETAGVGSAEIKAGQGKRGVWVFHIIDGVYKIRLVIPDGQVTERGDIEYVNGAAITYPITVSCYPDENGVKAYLYTAAA